MLSWTKFVLKLVCVIMLSYGLCMVKYCDNKSAAQRKKTHIHTFIQGVSKHYPSDNLV